MLSNKEKLEKCFRDSLALPYGTDVSEISYQGHPSWDSVGHMRLIAAIETIFDVMLTTDEVLDMASFQMACDILIKHGVSLDLPG